MFPSGRRGRWGAWVIKALPKGINGRPMGGFLSRVRRRCGIDSHVNSSAGTG